MPSEYHWLAELSTQQWYKSNWAEHWEPITWEGDVDPRTTVSELKRIAEQETLANMEKELAKQGIEATVTSVHSEGRIIQDTKYYLGQRQVWVRVAVDVDVTFTSPRDDLAGSPIAPILVAAIIAVVKIITVAVVVYYVATFAIDRLTNWAESMTTKTSKVKRTTYDEDGNIIETTEYEDVEPAPFGIAGVGTILLVGLLLVLVFMFGVPQLRRK